MYSWSEIWADVKIYVTLTPVAPVKPTEVSPNTVVWDTSVKGQSHSCSRKCLIIGLETDSQWVSIVSQIIKSDLDVGWKSRVVSQLFENKE